MSRRDQTRSPNPPPDVDTLGYMRVSTETQAGEHRTSIPEQRRAIVARATELGRVLRTEAIFEDPGISGATAEGRPGFMAMLAYAESHPRPAGSGVILVLNDSRFGRFDDPEEATHWRFVLKRLGWIVRFCEGDDVEDGVARGVLRFIGSAQASEYRANLKRTARRATRATAEQGRWQNRAPLGYRRLATRADGSQRVLEFGQRKADDEITRLTLGPELEQAAVRFAFETYASGQATLGQLVRLLRERFPCKKWQLGTLNQTLKNPAYVGDVVWCRRPADKGERQRGPVRPSDEWVVVPDAHPAIIRRETFAQVQQRLASNKRETRATAGGYPLSGFIRCTTCGHALVGGGGRRGPEHDPDRNRFYRDGAAFRDPNPCPGRIITLSKRWLEPVVIGAIAEVVADPRIQQLIAEELDRALDAANGGTAAQQRELERERAVLAQKRQRVVDAIGNEVLTGSEAAATMAQIRTRSDAIDAELERLRFAARRLGNVDSLRERLLAVARDFASTAARVTGPALRELLRPWLAEGSVNKETRMLTLVIRRIPDVYGSPWLPATEAAAASGGAGRSHSAISGPRAGIVSPVLRPKDGRNNTGDSRLLVVRHIRIPDPPDLRTECKHGHQLSGDNLYRTPEGRRECRACRRRRDRDRARAAGARPRQFRSEERARRASGDRR